MTDYDDIIEELKQKRDELRVQVHLASKEIKDEWEDLEQKMEELSVKTRQFSDDAKLKETGEGIGDALGQLGSELKRGYQRIRDALQD
jgi:chromosome segregation ATPase